MSNKVEKALGEPVAADFSDYVRKLRANLIFVSFISISLILGGLEIDPASSILGLKFKGLNNTSFLYGMFIVNSYMFIHFLWCSVDAFQEWGIRVSGTRLSFITTGKFSSEVGDYPSDPRQSTLYHWWKDQSVKIGSLAEPIYEINAKLMTWEQDVTKALDTQGNPNSLNVGMSIKGVSKDIVKLQSSIEATSEILNSARIPESLKRFDNRFQFFLRSQNLRWLLLELGLPIIMGIIALYLLAENLF